VGRALSRLPTGLVQVSKLEKPEEATAYARQFGFKVRTIRIDRRQLWPIDWTSMRRTRSFDSH
jgi:hypothetical protein